LIGFEDGKYFIGYRYIFPLFYRDEFIGSIESGISFEAIQQQIMQNSPLAIDYIISRNSAERTSHLTEDVYQVSDYSDLYFSEKNNNWTKVILLEEGSTTVKEVVKLLGEELNHKLNEQVEFSLAARVQDSFVIATLLPVRNFKGEIAAFCAFFQTGDEIVRMHKFFISIAIAALFAMTLIFGLFIYLFYSRQEIRKQAVQLEKINTSKDRFFSIISHDLISPFAQLMGFMDILLRDLDSFSRDELRNYLQQIQSNTKNTYNLVQNLLNWSRLQREVLELNPVLFDFSLLVIHCTSHYKLGIDNKKLKIIQKYPNPLMVNADEQILKTVVRNLFSNAIKFAFPKTCITINYRLFGGKLIFSIADEGTGISPEKQEELFSLSAKNSTPGTMNEKGTGLGLMLCKELIEVHGGRIWLESVPEKGTTVFFEIPCYNGAEVKESSAVLLEHAE
jgi:signal transduction histidine kinase